MKPEENPFFWQEKGPATRLLSWGVPLVIGFYGVVTVISAISQGEYSFLGERAIRALGVLIGLGVLVLGSTFFGAQVFAREKSQHTATALLLTGRAPQEVFWAKIRAAYWAHRYSFVALILLLGAWALPPWGPSSYTENGQLVFAAACVGVLLFGPGVSAVVGMVFGVVLSSPQQVLVALFLPLVVLQVLGPFIAFAVLTPSDSPLGFAVIIGVILILLAGFMRWKRRCSVWTISLMLAFWLAAFSVEIPLIASLLHGKGAGGAVLVVLSVFLLGAGFAYFWWRLGVSAFGEGMARESTSSSGALRA
jgi:hypothetical protein